RRGHGEDEARSGHGAGHQPDSWMTDFVQLNASANGARHSMPRSRARPANTLSSHQSRPRWDGKTLLSSSTFRRMVSAERGTYTDRRLMSPSHFGISYAR